MSVTYKWQPADYEKRMERHWKHLKEPVGDVMKQGMQMTANEAAGNMKNYMGTGRASVAQGGSHSLTQQYGSTGFKVGSYSISANIMEFGRAPNKRMPPPDSIASWLGSSDDAFVIARAIGKSGIKKTQPILKAKQTMFDKVNDMVAAAMEKVLDRLGLK